MIQKVLLINFKLIQWNARRLSYLIYSKQFGPGLKLGQNFCIIYKVFKIGILKLFNTQVTLEVTNKDGTALWWTLFDTYSANSSLYSWMTMSNVMDSSADITDPIYDPGFKFRFEHI